MGCRSKWLMTQCISSHVRGLACLPAATGWECSRAMAPAVWVVQAALPFSYLCRSNRRMPSSLRRPRTFCPDGNLRWMSSALCPWIWMSCLNTSLRHMRVVPAPSTSCPRSMSMLAGNPVESLNVNFVDPVPFTVEQTKWGSNATMSIPLVHECSKSQAIRGLFANVDLECRRRAGADDDEHGDFAAHDRSRIVFVVDEQYFERTKT